MIARFHYDDDALASLLKDEPRNLDSSNEEISRHVEHCEACQSRLESITFGDEEILEVQGFLTPAVDSDHFSFFNGRQKRSSLAFLNPSSEDDSIGRFGRYEIREVLGRGGMGVVLRGFDTVLARECAIKVLAPELATNAPSRMRFFREAKSATAVVHEHVIPIQTVNEEDGLPYLVMPLVEGKSLQQRVEQKDGALGLAEILRIGIQSASGLAAAHRLGLVHRDVKPANILLENGIERVMIADFGLARAADDANMTRSQVISGTPQYMSPEQARGGEIDTRSDLFSLGSVLYFMCCGHSPFRATTTMGVLNRIGNDQPRSIRAQNPSVPKWLEAIVYKLLEKDPQNRFQSAGEVEQLLSQWLAHVERPGEFESPKPIKNAGGLFGMPPVVKWLCAAGAMAFFAAAMSLIVLETNKGTITIESADENVVVHIKRGKKMVKELKVKKGKTTTRVAAGEYTIEIKDKIDDFEIKKGRVTLNRRGKWLVKIVEKIDPNKTAKAGDGSPLSKAMADIHIGKLTSAAEVLEKLLESDDKRVEEQALHQLLMLERNRDNLAKSIEYQDSFIEKFPDSEMIPNVKYLRGLNLMHTDKLDDAEHAFLELTIEHPHTRYAEYSQKGLGWVKEQRFRAAPDKELEKRGLDDLDVDELAILAGHRFSELKMKEAIELFDRVLELDANGKHTSYALTHLANANAALGRNDEAIAILEKWLRQFPDRAGAGMNMMSLGRLHAKVGNTERAIDYLQKVIANHQGSVYQLQAEKLLLQISQ